MVRADQAHVLLRIPFRYSDLFYLPGSDFDLHPKTRSKHNVEIDMGWLLGGRTKDAHTKIPETEIGTAVWSLGD